LEPIEVVGRRRLKHPEPERLRHRRGRTVVHRVRAADCDPARPAAWIEAGTQLDEPGVARRLRALQTPRQREVREWICVHKKRAAIFRPPPAFNRLRASPRDPRPYTPAVVFDFAGKISLNAVMKRAIPSA